jgi:RNA polymerase sigma-70 factor (ECF subfamily)
MEAHLRPVPAASLEEDGLPAPVPLFEDFFEATNRRVFTAMCLVTGDRYEAEEISQEAFVRILERWDHVSGLEDPESYLFRTAMNVFRNRYRRAALAVRRTFLVSPKSTDDLAGVEARHEVVRLLRPLAPKQRAAIVLTQILDLPAEEAGRMLGIKASSVRALASRARAHIKDEVVDPP